MSHPLGLGPHVRGGKRAHRRGVAREAASDREAEVLGKLVDLAGIVGQQVQRARGCGGFALRSSFPRTGAAVSDRALAGSSRHSSSCSSSICSSFGQSKVPQNVSNRAVLAHVVGKSERAIRINSV